MKWRPMSTLKLAVNRQQQKSEPAVDELPLAIAVWEFDHSLRFINRDAIRLTGFSHADLSDTGLWFRQIHPDDRATFAASWKEFRKGERKIRCDYRFFPKGSRTATWLREVSALSPSDSSSSARVVSTYIEINDLKGSGDRQEAQLSEAARGDILRTLFHDVRNCIQIVRMEIELAEYGFEKGIEVTKLTKTLASVDRLLRDLRDHLGPNGTRMTIEELEAILKNILHRLQRQFNRQKINLRLVRRESMPRVEVDKQQVSSALEGVLEFCGLLLRDGGDINIEAGQIDVEGQPYAELKVSTTSAGSSAIADAEAFRAAIQVGDSRVGIGIELARQILRRYQGEIFFRKASAREGQLIIQMKGLSA
jgi:signal transduction histidine kinase